MEAGQLNYQNEGGDSLDKGQWEKRKRVEFKKVVEGKERGKPPGPDTGF